MFEWPLGMLGRWGGITRAWLDDVLPPDAVDRCRDRVRLVVTQVGVRYVVACSIHPNPNPNPNPDAISAIKVHEYFSSLIVHPSWLGDWQAMLRQRST